MELEIGLFKDIHILRCFYDFEYPRKAFGIFERSGHPLESFF